MSPSSTMTALGTSIPLDFAELQRIMGLPVKALRRDDQQLRRVTDIVIQTAKEAPYGFNNNFLQKELDADSYIQLKRLQALALEFIPAMAAKKIGCFGPQDLISTPPAVLLVRSAFYRQEAARLLLEKGTPLAAAGEYGYAARLFTRSAKLGFVMDQRVEGREVQAVEYYSLIAGFFRSAEIYNRGEKFDEAMKIGLEGVSAFLNNKWRGDLFSNVKEGELSETPLLELRRSRLNPRTKREMADYLANLIIPYELACRRQGKEARVIGNVHYETVVLLIKRLRAP